MKIDHNTSKSSQSIFIVAGEASGDRHGADLVLALKKKGLQFSFLGIGGNAMQEAGVNILYHVSQMAILGLAEVIRHLPFIRKVLKDIEQVFKVQTPRAVILIDYPGLNLRIARMAHKYRIPVIYYISPQLWAWGHRRVEKIRKYVNLMLVIFQFEKQFYENHGIQAYFVGHPMVNQLHLELNEQAFREKHRLPAKKPILGLFPGSRKIEIQRMLPIMLQGTIRLGKEADFVPIIARAGHINRDFYSPYINNLPEVRLLESDVHALMAHCYVAVVASGTATLELGYLQTPMVVVYAVSPLTYVLGKRLIKVENIAMVNIVLGRKVVPELVQNQFTIKNVTESIRRYFADQSYYSQIKSQLARIHELLGSPGASERAAEKIISYLENLP